MRVRRSTAAVLVVVALVAGASCRRGRSAKSTSSRATTTSMTPTPDAAAASGPACTPARAQPAGQTTVQFSGREYIVYVPGSYTGAAAVPVVFNFHGFGSNATQQMQYGDFRPLAERDTFLVVAPNGQGAGAARHWNVTRLPAEADDVAFTLAILDSLQATFCIDAKRVFSTGMSAGSAMTVQLACRASDRFAAFGPVAVVYYTPLCDAARSVPIAAFMGTADPVVPFNGGKVRCCGSPAVQAAPTSMAAWASHDGCAAEPTEHHLSPMVLLREWPRCASPGEVRFYIIEGGGHTWPGGSTNVSALGVTTKEINASETLWAFFQAHPLPR